jgi:glutathione S-transferase
MIFTVAKQEFEDERYSFSFGTPGDWSTIQRPEFEAAKASGELDASLGKVPLLYVDGVKIGQSKAIERYLANTFHLMGSTPIEAAHIDQLCENVRDVMDVSSCASLHSCCYLDPVGHLECNPFPLGISKSSSNH